MTQLSPQERVQVSNLLGALQSGLSGAQGYSIFGNLQSEIASRQQRQQAHRVAVAQLLASQQQQQLQNQLAAAQFAQSQGLEQSNFLQDLYKQAQPQSETHTTTHLDAQGNPVESTFVSQPNQVPYSQVLGELGTRGPVLGLTQGQINAIGTGLDTAYSLPGITPTSEQNLRMGAGLKGNKALDPFWQGLRNAVMRGMQQGHDPQTIFNGIATTAAKAGYGSADERKRIATVVNEMMGARGYGAAPGPNQQSVASTLGLGAKGGTATGTESFSTGDALGALGSAAQKIVGAGALLGGAKLGKKVYRGVKGRLSPEQPAGAATPPEAAQTGAAVSQSGEVADLPVPPAQSTTSFTPPAEPSGGLGMGSLVDQLMGAGATSNIAGGSAAPTGGLGAAVEGATPFEYPFSNAQIMGALGRGVSPAAMLSSSAPGLASDTPLGPSTELFAGGPMGALGLAGAMSGVGVLPPAQAQAQQQWDALTDQQKAEAAYRAMQGDPKFAWVLPVITRAT